MLRRPKLIPFCRQNFSPQQQWKFRRRIECFSLYQHIKMPEQTQRSISQTQTHTNTVVCSCVSFRFVLFVVGFSFEAKFIAFINFMILTYSHFVLTRSLLLSRSHSCWAVLHFSLSRGAYIYLIKIWQCSKYTHSHSDTLRVRLLRFPLFFPCFTFLHLHSFSQFRCEAIELTTHKPQ